MGQVTVLLRQLADGDSSALDRLLPLVYEELRWLARVHLKGQSPDQTLAPTALVHEVFLKLVGGRAVDFENRAHFFAVASRAMRSVLVDHARRRIAQKRRDRELMVTFAAGTVQRRANAHKVVEIDAALEKLATHHERPASVVELLFFGGLTQSETATVLGISVPTVKRDWRFARAWLSRELQPA